MTTIPEKLAARLAKAEKEHAAIVRVLGNIPEGSSLKKKLDHAYLIPLCGADVMLGVNCIREDLLEILKEHPPEPLLLLKGSTTSFRPQCSVEDRGQHEAVIPVAPFVLEVDCITGPGRRVVDRRVRVKWYVRLADELVHVDAALMHDPCIVQKFGERVDGGWVWKGLPYGERIRWWTAPGEPPRVTIYFDRNQDAEALLDTSFEFLYRPR